MTSQRSRDVIAGRQLAEILRLNASPAQLLAILNVAANDPEQLHHVPHLVTAVREAGLLPDLMLERRRAA